MNKIPSVLIVEDTELTLAAFFAVLKRGLSVADVRAARSGEEALQILQETPVALVLSDYQLPGLDGVELLETLRSRGNQTPFLLISGAPDKAAVLRTLAHPGTDVLGKPFQLSELEGRMQRLLNNSLPDKRKALGPRLATRIK